MQFKPLTAVILLFVAQSIAAPSPIEEKYGSSSPEEYVCTSNSECPKGQHCCGFSPLHMTCLPLDTVC
ncbi:hypothetical protein K443DRAFT_677960 [Laccaria amethystina LaAM-08-1]|uniref:Unplaced genomic scaffold K443scaffold_64, whole genome shotgun sequence n=1 Tax=Laccaria amethystina LaAM-08-1 TaxID=1095629 RepID=A0A0C9XKB4_9AGAR|nr:hypothetical protein K443DRAFT_677960 [Laccaria amethystina LaAM-08-1]